MCTFDGCDAVNGCDGICGGVRHLVGCQVVFGYVAVKHPACGGGMLDIFPFHSSQLAKCIGAVLLAVDDELVEGIFDCDAK
jgi:hypothetical protein